MKYIKQLDSIRAIAVLMVIVAHWIPKRFGNLYFGGIGVDIFFVLSGFLITRILLTNRDLQPDKPQLIKNFIVRRTLRIFPIYYLTIIIFSFLIPFLREHSVYFITYTSNFLFFSTKQWGDATSHLWSLAVEEQFYLVWPWLMIYVPKKFILPLIVCFIGIGILTPLIYPDSMIHILTPACFSALGMGGLLAYLSIYCKDDLPVVQAFLFVATVYSIIALILIIHTDSYHLFGRVFTSIITLNLIMYAMNSKRGMLNWQVFMYVGRISYGMYLFHGFIPRLWDGIFGSGIEYPLLRFAGEMGLLLGISILSFKFLETPINNLKRYFEYRERDSDEWIFKDRRVKQYEWEK